jgi:1,4-alpha-glucan branching enzyme
MGILLKLLPLTKLGAREGPLGTVNFGIFLPWISTVDGNKLFVKIIHEKDQFLQNIQPLKFELDHSTDPDYGDYWSTSLDIPSIAKPTPDSAWGTDGRYVYRYCLENPNLDENKYPQKLIDWIIDPCASEFGIGKLSAITLGYKPYQWSPSEATWKTPDLEDLIIYELMINEFGGNIDQTIARLDYLADLGINCIELMPLSNVAATIDWGYLPIGYFGVDERFGNRKDMQKLIDAAHQRGMAVIVDSVYAHTAADFCYFYIYNALLYQDNPFMKGTDEYGKTPNYDKALTQDFFYTVNYQWLKQFHVDGFRYDNVPNFWDGPTGNKYAALAYETYQLIKSKKDDPDWQRFYNNGKINLIQCAEQLNDPKGILTESYSNATWQDKTLNAGEKIAKGNTNELTNLGFMFCLDQFPRQQTTNGDTIQKTALQYFENHDHSRFICNFSNVEGDPLIWQGTRSLFYKLQPYLIGMLMAKGIPLLWQGQEFAENYYLPTPSDATSMGRVLLFRPVRWDYFYDQIGKSTVGLFRNLIKIRRKNLQIRQGEGFFYNDQGNLQNKGIIIFHRVDGQNFSLIALNFSDQEQTVPFTFNFAGNYIDELPGYQDIGNITQSETRTINVHSNYGRILTIKQS